MTMAVALDGLARSIFICSAKDPEHYPQEKSASVVLDLFLKGGLAKSQGRLASAS
jgi:hypothetical protein